MTSLLRQLWSQENGQDITEYAVMLAAILLLGGNANNDFSSVTSSPQ
jgi:hypothetical protein